MVISKAVKSYKQLAHVRYRKSEIDDFCTSVTSIFDNKQVHSGEYKQFILNEEISLSDTFWWNSEWLTESLYTIQPSSKLLNSDRNTTNSFDPAKNE